MDRPDISVALLNAFLETAQAGSFSAVARQRGVDPSIISRQVKTLEDAVGFRLFDRTTRRLSLTEAGSLYRTRVRDILDELDAAGQQAVDLLRQPSGLLRVTTSPAFGECWLVPRLGAFRTSYPDVSIDLILTNLVVDIAADGIDLAIRLSSEPQGMLISRKLMDTRYHVVASPGYLAGTTAIEAPNDLKDHACITLPFPGYRSRWKFRQNGDETQVAVSSDLTMSSPLAIRRAVRDGMGIALLADWVVAEDLAAGKLVDLLPDYEASAEDFTTAAWLLFPSREYVPSKLRVFMDHLIQTRH